MSSLNTRQLRYTIRLPLLNNIICMHNAFSGQAPVFSYVGQTISDEVIISFRIILHNTLIVEQRIIEAVDTCIQFNEYCREEKSQDRRA